MARPQTFVAGFHDAAAVARMAYRPLGRFPLVSALSLGTSAFSGMYVKGGAPSGQADATAVVRESLVRGVNLLDTAPWYGQGRAEALLGEALRGVPREAFYVSTKVGRYDPSPAGMFDFTYERTARSIDESRERLGLDVLDAVQVHDAEFAPSADVVLRETLPALLDAQAAGKVRHLGVTGYQLDRLRELVARAPRGAWHSAISFCRLTLADDSLAASGTLAALAGAGVGVVNASPLAMGLLAPAGPPAWHPASPALREAAAGVARDAAAEGVDLARVALAHALAAAAAAPPGAGVATTMTSAEAPAVMRANVELATGVAPLTRAEAAFAARARAAFAAAAARGADMAWEGAETGKYWRKVGQAAVEAAYARVAGSRGGAGGSGGARGPPPLEHLLLQGERQPLQ